MAEKWDPVLGTPEPRDLRDSRDAHNPRDLFQNSLDPQEFP